jgi:hypothetical protein
MPSPSSFAVFAVVNAVTWPGFALAYWYFYQREEEKLLDAIGEETTETADSTEVERETPGIGGDS